MEQFVVSARKYRPQVFDAVVGQRHITDTLLKSVESDHLAQALLFCGPRGVGKTTCARILAKVINQNAQLTDEELALNIFELDAASNNSVDDIRRLIDQVRFAPQTGKFKVYIIDEVHMLSQQAFNAFLKTLEEPPAHAIFILATTEKHKIIPTILSRCQIFDFKRITVDDIAQHLAYVAQQEGISAEPEALHMIAEKADGALRDALSLFDRMVSFSGDQLSYEQVVEVLDILDYNYFFKAVELANNVNYPDLLLLYNEVLEKGFNGHEFVVGMSKHFRDLLVAREPKTVALLEVGPSIKERYLQQSQSSSTRFLLHGLKVFNELDGQYKSSSQPRILVELGLLKLVEFISQEKKKSQPNVKPNNTDAFLPEKLPTRDQPLTLETEASSVEQPDQSIPNSPEKVPVSAHSEANSIQSKQRQNTGYSEDSLSSSPPSSTRRTVIPPSQRMMKKRKVGGGLEAELASMSGGGMPQVEEHVEEEAAPVVQGGPQNVFTESEMKAAIKEYADGRHVGRNLRSILISNPIKILDKNTLEIEVDNNIQTSIFNESQKDLVPFLRDKLKNFSLRFELKVVEREDARLIYLPEDKFRAMAEKNPTLLYLREKLNTDLE